MIECYYKNGVLSTSGGVLSEMLEQSVPIGCSFNIDFVVARGLNGPIIFHSTCCREL